MENNTQFEENKAIYLAARALISVPEQHAIGFTCLDKDDLPTWVDSEDEEAPVKWCSLGAMYQAIYNQGITEVDKIFGHPVVDILYNKICTLGIKSNSVGIWNDTSTHAEIMRVFDEICIENNFIG